MREAAYKLNKQSRTNRIVFYVVIYLVFAVIIFLTLYPFWNLLVISISSPRAVAHNEVTIWPKGWTLISYEWLFKDSNLGIMLRAFQNSIGRTLLGTVLNVFFSALIAYALSCKHFILRRFMNVYVVIPMYVSAGLIPTYILFSDLNLLDTFWVYIIPNLISAYNIILLRTSMGELSASLSEAARIDGASDAKVLFSIILPLSLPVLATTALFIAVFHWGAYQDTMFFATQPGLVTLQYELYKLVSAKGGSNVVAGGGQDTPKMVTLNAAITMIATLPIVAVYPFLQRFFVNGMTLGAVKE